MELFISPTLFCLLSAGFIIALAMFGRQYLFLVSCAATWLLFQWRWVWALAIYHPLRGSSIKSPTSAPERYVLQETGKCQKKISLQRSAQPVITPGLHILSGGGDVVAKPKKTTHRSFLPDEVIKRQSPTPCLLKPPKAKPRLMFSLTINPCRFCLWQYNLTSLFWEGLSPLRQRVKP